MSISWQHVDPAPALLVVPPAAASLDEAHAAIELWEHYSKKRLDLSQRLTVEVMMAQTAEGRWAAATTGREMARQNGKGDEVEVVELWGLVQRSEAILHTVHDAVLLASQTQQRMLGVIEGHADLRRLKKRAWQGTGQQMIEMRNGGVIWYRTRTNGGGRGVDDVDRLVVDEAQHATEEHIAAVSPTLLANANPQMNVLGTAGLPGVSGWWWSVRKRALRPDPGSFGYVGHTAERLTIGSGDRVVSAPVDVGDRGLWRASNPAVAAGRGQGMAYLEEQLRRLGPEAFAREHLCVWDPEPAVAGRGELDLDAWLRLADPSADRGQAVVFGVDVGSDRLAHIAVAWRRPDGLVQVMLADSNVSPLRTPARLSQLAGDWKGPVMLGGPSAALEGDVKGSRVLSAGEFAAACGQFEDLFAEREIRHGNQPALNDAVKAATFRPVGTAGGRALNLRAGSESGPLAAVVRAIHGLGAAKPTVASPLVEDRPARSEPDIATMPF